MIINTPQLYLREFDISDFEALREIESDSEVFRYRSRQEISEADTRQFLLDCQRARKEQPPAFYAWAAILLAENKLIGQVGLTPLPDQDRASFLWFSLNRRCWGQGYMTEIVRAVLEIGFNQLNFGMIHAHCRIGNIASRRVLEKAGLNPLGEENVIDRNGVTHLECHYTLSAAEFRKRS